MRLVLIVHLITEGFSLGIKNHRHTIRSELAHHAANHVYHTIDGVGWDFTITHGARVSMKCAIKVRRAVDQNQWIVRYMSHRRIIQT
ncbi:Uncharacterised protein [Vibrio cholerae]|uniref:Uncharacterized protein n=1 Tax=Vibrio cholerae TaxID=666 RepID=A0A655Z0F2_VIBCL|nr:Uncharacterised protein [Vibrio cholerae]CSC55820.1 Uncharacterised protein [Vibrio cholerae]